MFTFKAIPFGIPFFNASSVIDLMKGTAWLKSASSLKSHSEKPMAGMPSIAASMAADMVPEYSTLIELLLPWLIPLTTRSGLRSRNT
ncbi:hypothetical protein D3C87_1797860 [compost metagenome]